MAAKFLWKLKEMREARDLTRMDIVRQANIAYGTVYALETERMTGRLDATVLLNLIRVLNCEMSDLVTLIDDEELRETVE